MANFTLKVKADPYFNAEALAEISARIEDMSADIEKGMTEPIEFEGDNFTATLTVEPEDE